MNELEKLKARVVEMHPNAKVEITPPAMSDGIWWLDIDLSAKRIVVEWTSSNNFSVTTPSLESYGESGDESYQSLEKVVRRINQLLINDDRTSPLLPVLLARLRESRGVTQQELAAKLGIRQASISGMERRDDIQLSTLRRIVDALGGCVQIFARFPEGRFQLDDSASDDECFEEVVEYESPPLAMQNVSKAFVHLSGTGKIQHALDFAERVKVNKEILEMV